MKNLKLHFVSDNHLNLLLLDEQFKSHIAYLDPIRIDDHNLQLKDPIEEHHELDSEAAVLSIFARGIKRIIYPDSGYDITFIDPRADRMKKGLIHHRSTIIDSVRFQ